MYVRYIYFLNQFLIFNIGPKKDLHCCPAREFVPLPSQPVINVADARSSGLVLILWEQPLSISVNSTGALAL